MPVTTEQLPTIIRLEDYGGDYSAYIDAIYEVFRNDFIVHKAHFGGQELRMKYHPLIKDRAYTFYHMTHKGEDEANRIPDLRRCERIPWARPTVEQAQFLGLRFWEQTRKGNHRRVCIWLDTDTGDNYYVILEVRAEYVLLWTAFYGDYAHSIRKKESEYNEWKRQQDRVYSPKELIEKIMFELKSKSRQ